MLSALNNYALYAVTGTVATLDYLIDLVKRENEEWDSMSKRDMSYIRLFHVRSRTNLLHVI